MSKRIAILHFASPPTVGGVESTIAHHACGLADMGYAIRIITGNGAEFDPRVEVCLEPGFDSKHPDVLKVKAELDAGQVTPAFWMLVKYLQSRLLDLLTDCAVCIAHNIHTLHKNLALTMALYQITQQKDLGIRHIAWVHDLAWTNPQYQAELYDINPWNLLRQKWLDVHYITISDARQTELATLLKVNTETIHVITGGIDLERFLRWTDTTQDIVQKLGLLEADGLLLLPARLTRRKNIELALHVLGELRHQSQMDFRLIVTGPPGPHNPANRGYLLDLLDLRQHLQLENTAHFLYELREPPLSLDDDTLADFFRLCDVLFFPSLQEGFGIPLLEAGLAGLPVYCSDLLPLRQTGQNDVVYFDLAQATAETIARRMLDDFTMNASYRFKIRVRQSYRWETIIRTQIIPLLEEN